MNNKFAIVSVIFIICIVILGSLTGIPIKSEVKEGGCQASYKMYLFPKNLCQYLTYGHCATTKINKFNAEIEVGRCLCDKYLRHPNNENKNQILQKCDLPGIDCDSSIERIKNDYCDEGGLNSLECRDYFDKNNTQDIDLICQNKEKVFYKIFID